MLGAAFFAALALFVAVAAAMRWKVLPPLTRALVASCAVLLLITGADLLFVALHGEHHAARGFLVAAQFVAAVATITLTLLGIRKARTA